MIKLTLLFAVLFTCYNHTVITQYGAEFVQDNRPYIVNSLAYVLRSVDDLARNWLPDYSDDLTDYIWNYSYNCTLYKVEQEVIDLYDNDVWKTLIVRNRQQFISKPYELACDVLVEAGYEYPKFQPEILESLLNQYRWEIVYTTINISILWPYYLTLIVICWFYIVIYFTGKGLRLLVDRYKSVRMNSPICPINLGDLRNSFAKFLHDNPIVQENGSGHETLAKIRADLERWTMGYMFRCTNKLRDLGGSLTRNARYGRRLHICFPNLDAADHARLGKNSYANDVALHKAEDCDANIPFAVMSYVDFHLSTEELAKAIKGPTLIVTHPYSTMQGSFSWFDGEATGTILGNFVTMTTRKGTTYTHKFHDWHDEGIIFSHDSVAHYIKIGLYGNSVVYLAYPATGTFHHNDPTALRANRKENVLLPNGVTTVRQGDSYHFVKDRIEIGAVLASTIIRCAYTVAFTKREENFMHSINGIIRNRVTADKQDHSLLEHITHLVIITADDMALSTGHIGNFLPSNVIGLSLWKRLMVTFIRKVYILSPAISQDLAKMLWKRIVGQSPETALFPWLWREVRVPNYEHVGTGNGLLGDGTKRSNLKRQPFQPQGPGNYAGGAPINVGNAVSNSPKPSCKCGTKGRKQTPNTTPNPPKQTTSNSQSHRSDAKDRRAVRRQSPKTTNVKSSPSTSAPKSRRLGSGPDPNAKRVHSEVMRYLHCNKCQQSIHGVRHHGFVWTDEHQSQLLTIHGMQLKTAANKQQGRSKSTGKQIHRKTAVKTCQLNPDAAPFQPVGKAVPSCSTSTAC